MRNIYHLILGTLFGIVLIKAEVVSWFRIQEMFRFQSFHMYGIIGSAVAVGALSVFIIKKLKLKDRSGNQINLIPKTPMYKANFLGGTIFGLGWAFTGACPGPIYSLIGYGIWVYVMVLLSAYTGTYFYGKYKDKLPH